MAAHGICQANRTHSSNDLAMITFHELTGARGDPRHHILLVTLTRQPNAPFQVRKLGVPIRSFDQDAE